MKRSIGVTVIAILSLLGSVLTLLIGVLMGWVMFRAPVASPNQFPGSPAFLKAMMLVGVLVYVVPAIWGICTSIGLFRLKDWARISMIAFAVLLILMGGFGILMSLVIPLPTPPNLPSDKSIEVGVRLSMGVFSAALLGLGIWWVAFFSRKKVRQQFVGLRAGIADGAPPQGLDSLTLPPPMETMPSTPRRPLSITILAWLLLAGCAMIPLNVLLRAPAVLFTKVVTGYPASVYYIALAGLQLYIGIGLLRLRPAARVVCIWYLAYGFVNAAVFYLAPGGHARMLALIEKQQSVFPWIPPGQNQFLQQVDLTPLLIVGACVGLAVLAVPLYFLITRRQAFETAGTAVAGQ
jgi:hypothetical protein